MQKREMNERRNGKKQSKRENGAGRGYAASEAQRLGSGGQGEKECGTTQLEKSSESHASPGLSSAFRPTVITPLQLSSL